MSREWWLVAVEIWLSLMQQGQECKSRCEYFLSRICLLEVLLLRGFVAEPQMLLPFSHVCVPQACTSDHHWLWSMCWIWFEDSHKRHGPLELVQTSMKLYWYHMGVNEESIKLVGWHWNLNWRLQLNWKWIIAELQKRNFILTLFFECEICSTRCSQDVQDDIVITNELWHSIKVCLLMSYCSFFQSWTAF